ncbi:MAG: hypothetical protein M3N56_16445 [Actinomycetota bacterium]|nr:hypothetical protein [Actinomycetota bacterium]
MKPKATAQASTGLVDQATDTAKQAAGKAKQVAGKAAGPALAVGAAAVGVAGGMALKGRRGGKKVLGVPVPRAVKPGNVDVEGIVKTVGKATKQFAATSKSVSKDIERAGDKAERIGKILD